jgi:predicted unusual protein kinase regulating ubiquinone biosynthesis (AarF/ABC1/UbiB family)
MAAGELSSDAPDSSRSHDGIGQGRLRRTAPFVGLTARIAGEAAVAGLSGRLAGAEGAEFHLRAAERYAELLGRSKGALMKAGQVLSFMVVGSVVPEEFYLIYQQALARLCSDAPPMAPELARAVLEQELGRPTDDAFAAFDWEPLAAASIGQVHAARLHDGREVAVKIQYPGVADAIGADLENVQLLGTFLSLIFSGLSAGKLRVDPRGVAREVSVRIAEELDYRLEAAHQAEFAGHYRGHPFIHVPEVVGELCSERVLTQDLVQGSSWSEALSADQDLRDKWAEAIHRFAFGSYSRLLLFNADPHPGNYVFHDDGSVSFLDFGCVKRLRGEEVAMMDVVVRECFRNDVLGTWRAGVEAGFIRSSDPVTPQEFFAFLRNDWEMLWADERFVVTPEYVARWTGSRFAPSGPSRNVIRHLTLSAEFTFMGRMELGVTWAIAQLRAGNNWGSIAAERFTNAAPLTPMGKLHHQFFEGAHVPGALDVAGEGAR